MYKEIKQRLHTSKWVQGILVAARMSPLTPPHGQNVPHLSVRLFSSTKAFFDFYFLSFCAF